MVYFGLLGVCRKCGISKCIFFLFLIIKYVFLLGGFGEVDGGFDCRGFRG